MSNDNLNWLALQYVLGELPDAERDAFEARLAGDPSLCEAVTTASRLVLTARAALEPQVLLARATERSNRSSWLAVAATSVSVAVVGLFALQVSLPKPRPANPAAAELVSLWQSGTGDEAETDEPDSDMADGAGDVSVPSWMLAAVSLAEDPAD